MTHTPNALEAVEKALDTIINRTNDAPLFLYEFEILNSIRAYMAAQAAIVGGDVKEARDALHWMVTNGHFDEDQTVQLTAFMQLVERALTGPALDAGKVQEGWSVVEKATCFALIHYGKVIASLVGEDAERNAAIIAHALTASPATSDDGWRGIDTNKFVSAKRFLVLNEDQNIPYIAWRYTEDNWCSKGRDRENPTHWKELTGLSPKPPTMQGE